MQAPVLLTLGLYTGKTFTIILALTLTPPLNTGHRGGEHGSRALRNLHRSGVMCVGVCVGGGLEVRQVRYLANIVRSLHRLSAGGHGGRERYQELRWVVGDRDVQVESAGGGEAGWGASGLGVRV